MFARIKQTAPIKLLLTVGFSLFLSQPGETREQWQMNRQDAPPTAPMGTNRYTSGQSDGNFQGQLPGFTGSSTPSMTGGYGNSSRLGGQAGGGQPGTVNGVGMPDFLNPQSGGLPGQPGQPGQPVGVPGGMPGGMPGSSGWNPAGLAPGMTGAPVKPLLPVQPSQGGVTPDFLKGIVGKRINAGTILSGVSESNLSSVKSKRGDVFSIGLPHGLVTEGEEVVPPMSRILGVVVDAAPAKMQRASMPGRLQISLKTLVFPDGRTSKINGFIDTNPAHNQLKEPKVKMAGVGLGDYGQAFKGMLYSSVSGIAWVHNKQMRGKEFILKIGDPVSVKLNTSIDLAKMGNPTAALNPSMPPGAVPGVPGLIQGGIPSSVPGLAPNTVPGAGLAPGAFGAQGAPGSVGSFSSSPSAQIPGLTQGGVPGMSSAPTQFGQPGYGTPVPLGATTPPVAPGPNFAAATGTPNAASGLSGLQNSSQLPPVNQGTFFPNKLQSPNQLPSGGPSQEPAGFDTDPNSIFKTPISSPQVSTPDPF